MSPETERVQSERTPRDGPWIPDVTRRRRPPQRLPRSQSDVYLTTRSDFRGQFARCRRLVYSAQGEVQIHGMGHAVSRAINLALRVQAECGPLELWTQTSTVTLEEQRSMGCLDDVDVFDQELESQSRQISAIHIRLYRPK
uniref:ribonuclease P protein subunit p20 n=1 Tax=Myxine glutinosa TaxID=7769 RepID=UPI00358E3783